MWQGLLRLKLRRDGVRAKAIEKDELVLLVCCTGISSASWAWKRWMMGKIR